MVHKKKGLSETRLEGLRDIIELDNDIQTLADGEMVAENNNLWSSAEESRRSQDVLRKKRNSMIKKHFGSMAKYRKSQIKYGKRFR